MTERNHSSHTARIQDSVRRLHVEAIADRIERSDDPRSRADQRTLWRHGWPWLAWITLVTAAAVWWHPRAGSRQAWGLIALLLPATLALSLNRLRWLRRLDEMQQRIELLAMATAFLFAIAVLLVAMLLHMLSLPARVPPLPAFLLLYVAYALSRCWYRRRSR